MNMGMGFSISQGQQMQFRQRMSMSERLEMRLAQVDDLASVLKIGIKDHGRPVTDRYQEAVKAVSKLVSNPELADPLERSLNSAQLRDELIARSAIAAVPTSGKINDLVVNSLWRASGGDFELQDQDGNVEFYKTSLGYYRMAFFDPERLNKEISDLMASAARAADISSHQESNFTVLNEATNARLIRKVLNEPVRSLIKILDVALNRNDAAGQNPLRTLMRELTIEPNLLPIISDRILKRFATACCAAGTGASDRHLEVILLNRIGEVALASLGIINPSLFQIETASIDQEAYNRAKENLKELNVDIDKLAKHYRLTARGTFYWSRWATNDLLPSSNTDQWIRDFITERVREGRDALMQVAQGTFGILNEIRTVLTEGGSTVEGRAVTTDRLRILLVDLVGQDTFQNALNLQIRETWYPALDKIFIARQMPGQPGAR